MKIPRQFSAALSFPQLKRKITDIDRCPLFGYVSQCNALVAQSVERNHGKVEVRGSNPRGGSFLFH